MKLFFFFYRIFIIIEVKVNKKTTNSVPCTGLVKNAYVCIRLEFMMNIHELCNTETEIYSNAY